MDLETEVKGKSISQLYDEVVVTYKQLDEGVVSCSDPKFQALYVLFSIFYLKVLSKLDKTHLYSEQVKKALKSLSTIKSAMNMLCLFSRNERIDEINTSYLKFLVVDYYVAKFTLWINTQAVRQQLLEQAKTSFLSFLSLCSDYELTIPESKLILEGKQVNKIINTREEKIAKYRKEKEMNTLIETLNARKTSKDTSDTFQSDEDDSDNITRDYYLALTELFQLKTVDEMVSIHQECGILKTMLIKGSDPEKIDVDKLTWRLDSLSSLGEGNSNLLDSKGKPTRPFVITSKQKELRDQVFRPGWRLPTMTIEEYLDIEMKRGNFLQGGGERPQKPDEDLNDDMDALDAATMKQRKWDEFTDDNPRGAGNRGNKG